MHVPDKIKKKLIDALYILKDAWAKVSKEIISKYFKKADTEGEILIQVPTPSNMTEQEFADAVNQDMDEATCAQLDEEEIVQQVKRQRVETDSTEDDEQEEDYA